MGNASHARALMGEAPLLLIRKRTPAALVLASVLLCATSVVAAAESTLDQAQDRSWQIATGLSSEPDMFVQTFTAGRTGRLDRIELPLYQIDHPGDLVVDVRATGGGHILEGGGLHSVAVGLPGPVLSRARMSEASLGLPPGNLANGTPPFQWVSIVLPLPVHVEAGVLYGLEVWAPDQSHAGSRAFYAWGRGSVNSQGTDWYLPGRVLSILPPPPVVGLPDGPYWTEENLATDRGFRT
jgi:hypothetical protein